MPLFKTSPRIEVHVPQVVIGVPSRAVLTLHCSKAVPIDSVNVRLSGEALHRPQGSSASPSAPDVLETPMFLLLVRHFVPIRERVELAAGSYHYPFDILLPDGLPGSYRGPRLNIRWRISVRVSIPWWPDPISTFDLSVVPRSPPPATASPPILFTTNPNGPSGRSPYAEVSLASTVVRAGEVLRGLISVANTAHHRYRVRLTLMQRLATRHVGISSADTDPITTVQLRPPARDDQPFPFGIQIPTRIIPAFAAYQMQLSWQLSCVIESDAFSARTLMIPIDIVPRDTVLCDDHRAPSLALIGSERRDQAWSSAAAATGYAYDSGALTRQLGACVLTISLESSGDHGNRLVADARIDEVDIGLCLEDGMLRCRDAEQSARIAEATDALTKKHRLASADDRHLRYEVPDGGTRADALVALARWFEVLVTTVLQVRAALPAPASVAHLQPAFERAAEVLAARFVPAGMDVWGCRNDVRFSLETRWNASGGYRNTTLTVGSVLPISARFHGHFTPEAWPEQLPEGLAELLEDVVAVVIWAWRIELHLPPVPNDDTREVEIDRWVDRLEALHAVGRRLSMRDGVYR